jgi:hypothetical protein
MEQITRTENEQVYMFGLFYNASLFGENIGLAKIRGPCHPSFVVSIFDSCCRWNAAAWLYEHETWLQT